MTCPYDQSIFNVDDFKRSPATNLATALLGMKMRPVLSFRYIPMPRDVPRFFHSSQTRDLGVP